MPIPYSRLLVAAAGSCLGTAAFAQAASPAPPPQAAQVTPRDLRPDVPPAPPASVPRSAPETAPKLAETLFVSVDAIAVDDGFPELASQTAALVPAYTRHRIAASEFYTLTAAIEALYQAAGYPLVRVTVPPQKLADGGTLHLKVLDGFIEQVDVAGVAAPARDAVQRTLEPLVGRRRLTNAALERALTLAGRLPGLALRSALGAGKAAGAAVLVLEGEQAAWSGSLAGDDRLTGALGPWELTAQVRLNQPLGLREQEYAYVSGGPDITMSLNPDIAVRRVFGGGVIVPLGFDGWQFNPEYTWSDTRPRTPPGGLRTRSQFDRITLRLIAPLIVEHTQELTLTGTLDATNQTNGAPDFGFTFTHDRLRIGRLGLDWSGAIPSGSLHASATGSQGFGGLGARTWSEVEASQVGFSRPGVSPTFTKLEIALTLAQPLPLALQSTLTLRGQLAKGVLPSSEEFSVDGEEALSMFSSGAISDDEGATARAELARPFGVNSGSGAATLAPYVFGAVGKTRSKRPPPAYPGIDSSYGVGLRIASGPASLGAEFGRHAAHGGEPDGAQFFFKAQVQF
jgi:hemolysin activation/secretion protein